MNWLAIAIAKGVETLRRVERLRQEERLRRMGWILTCLT
jgi:hypothetical protein